MSSETLYAALFIATLPALWTLAALLDRFLPDKPGHHAPWDERQRQKGRLP